MVAETGVGSASLPGADTSSTTDCTAIEGPSKLHGSVVATRSRLPPAKICAQLWRTASKPTRRTPRGWTHTTSSLSAHTAIIAGRSARSKAS